MTTLLEIGAALRAERKRQKRFQKEVAEAAGIHRNTLAELEAGRGNVELKTFIAVCTQLGLAIRIVPKEAPATVGAEDTQQTAVNALMEETLGSTLAKN